MTGRRRVVSACMGQEDPKDIVFSKKRAVLFWVFQFFLSCNSGRELLKVLLQDPTPTWVLHQAGRKAIVGLHTLWVLLMEAATAVLIQRVLSKRFLTADTRRTLRRFNVRCNESVEGNKEEQETRKNVDKEEIETVGEDGAEEA
ncbi:hypothetical protein Peur_028269 [Populus x canadensis]